MSELNYGGESSRALRLQMQLANAKPKEAPWVSTLKDDVIELVQNGTGIDSFLKVALKLERKCAREVKRLKGTAKASNLLKYATKMLRSLKFAANELTDNESKVNAALGMILTHLIAAAAKSKETQTNAQKSADVTYTFVKRTLDANTEWVLTTLLASVCETVPNPNSFEYWMIALAVKDPVLNSFDGAGVVKAMGLTQLLLQLEEPNTKPKLKVAPFWLREQDFYKRSRNSDVPKLIKAAKRALKIKIEDATTSSAPRIRRNRSTEATSTLGVQWVLSTTPSEPSETVQVPENDEESEVVEVNDSDSGGEPSTKRQRVSDDEENAY